MRSLALLAAAGIGLALLLVLRLTASPRAFPALGSNAALRIELARGSEQLVMLRPGPTATWSLASADDAPADDARVAALLKELGRLVPGDAVPVPKGPATDLRVSGPDGRVLAEARAWPGVLALPDGPPRAAPGFAPPDLAPARWSSLVSPELAAEDVAGAVAVTPEGPRPLAPAARDALAAALATLPGDWQPARNLNWAGARYYQLRLADGALVEVQVATAPDGRTFVRFNSPTRPELARLRAFAFLSPGLSPG